MSRLLEAESEIINAENDLRDALVRLAKAKQAKDHRPIAVMITQSAAEWQDHLAALENAGLDFLAATVSAGITGQ